MKKTVLLAALVTLAVASFGSRAACQ